MLAVPTRHIMSLICAALFDDEMLLKRITNTRTKNSIMIVTPDMTTVTAMPSSSSLRVEFVMVIMERSRSLILYEEDWRCRYGFG